MQETSKSIPIRTKLNHYQLYLNGLGIDIGAGNDPLTSPFASDIYQFDVMQGDAQTLASIPANTFDFAYSSHCLEHMRDVDDAIENWSRVIKPNGFIFFTVPDFTLYEKHRFPSVYNSDHKHTFSMHINRIVTGRDNHFNIGYDLFPILEKHNILMIDSALEDDGFDYTLPNNIDQTNGMPALCQIRIIGKKL